MGTLMYKDKSKEVHTIKLKPFQTKQCLVTLGIMKSVNGKGKIKMTRKKKKAAKKGAKK